VYQVLARRTVHSPQYLLLPQYLLHGFRIVMMSIAVLRVVTARRVKVRRWIDQQPQTAQGGTCLN
jgi:hypothetical protein